MYTKSIWIRSSSNWKKYNYLSYKSGELSHTSLGPFMAICRYLPEGTKGESNEKAWVKIRPSTVADSAASEYNRLRIFYGNVLDNIMVTVSSGDLEILNDSLSRKPGINELTCVLNEPEELTIGFSGKGSPDIYGISIESTNGIVVDNIPQRGSAGLEFTMVDKTNLAEAYRLLSPDLIILQYGLNIVRNVRKDYSYYEKGVVRQLNLLKEVSPGTPVLVISVTDMDAGEGDSIVAYSNIPAIIDAQQKATIKAGAEFWNAYNAMGGSYSAKKWAEKKPPLVQKDLVHFTYPGADTISKLLADAVFLPALRTDTFSVSKTEPVTDTVSAVLVPALQVIVSEKPGFTETLISELFSYDASQPLIFSTPAFWLFFLIVLAGYSLIYKKLVLRNGYLFIISLFFYYKSGGLFLLLLIFVTLIDYSCGLLIHHSKSKGAKRLFILFSIISNLGILAWFKYTGFFVETINDIFGTQYQVYDYLAAFSNNAFGTSFNVSNIILPVGVSFFTFQSLSYTIDVYRNKMEPVKNVIDFGFYVSFFPQLVAGPIVRASEFIPQLYSEFRLNKREFSHALFLISKGLIKKIIISDFIATNFIDRVFDAPSIYSGFENLMAVYGYGLQIYCDFSGYTDIAIGLGLILGFRLPLNFNSPYKAVDITDFWKRWHISLSRWLKDYLYIPLGGNRKGKFRTNINLIITMLLGGLWHGASMRFIVWGFLHGIGLVINRIWNSIFGEKLKSGRVGRAISVFITFQFVSFCWIFFRANDMESVRIMLSQIFENFSPGSYMTVIPAYSSAFLLMGVGYVIHFLPESTKEAYRGFFIGIPLIAQLFVIMCIAILLFQMRSTDVVPFIYFRF
jgi:alginate O-acetyltransferase complex protein AlgI